LLRGLVIWKIGHQHVFLEIAWPCEQC
jgi:hypothetical protein